MSLVGLLDRSGLSFDPVRSVLTTSESIVSINRLPETGTS